MAGSPRVLVYDVGAIRFRGADGVSRVDEVPGLEKMGKSCRATQVGLKTAAKGSNWPPSPGCRGILFHVCYIPVVEISVSNSWDAFFEMLVSHSGCAMD